MAIPSSSLFRLLRELSCLSHIRNRLHLRRVGVYDHPRFGMCSGNHSLAPVLPTAPSAMMAGYRTVQGSLANQVPALVEVQRILVEPDWIVSLLLMRLEDCILVPLLVRLGAFVSAEPAVYCCPRTEQRWLQAQQQAQASAPAPLVAAALLELEVDY